MMRSNGKIKNIDMDGFRKFLTDLPEVKKYNGFTDIEVPDYILNSIKKMVSAAVESGELAFSWRQNTTVRQQRYEYEKKFADWYESRYTQNGAVLYLEKMIQYSSVYGQPLEYIYADDSVVCMEFPQYSYAIPVRFVEYTPFHDYSDVPVNRIGVSGDLSAMLPAVEGEVTQNMMKGRLQEKKQEIASKISEIEAKEEEKKQEIEKIKAEIEAKYKKTFELIEQKKADLEKQKEQLEREIFVLDTKIYGIRCFFGEVVNFTPIMTGKNADVNEPVILHQKIRFLDEELAKWASIYDVDGDDAGLFEELLRVRKDIRDFFFPGEKSISLVRISRDSKLYRYESVEKSDKRSIFCTNILKEYEVFHGNRLALMIRNGENCYIGWTDVDRIKLSDENAFLTPKEASVDTEASVETTDYFGRKSEVKEIHTSKEDVASRYFLFSLMQGLVLNSKLITLPDGQDIIHGDSKYVIYSMADSWLKDTRHGDFTDILKKYNGILHKGDMILTLRGVRAEGRKYETWSNDRGVGAMNRTHDVYAEPNMLYPVNYLENTAGFLYTFEVGTPNLIDGKVTWHKEEKFSRLESFEEYVKNPGLGWRYSDNSQFKNIKRKQWVDQKVYVSLEKDENWRTGAVSRANFHLMPSEYINLTFLNTDLIRYVIMNRDLGKRFNVNFSYMIPYLNHALEYLTQREIEEESLISQYAALPDNWRMQLSEWKMANEIHKITDYQAKRFAKIL